MKLVNCKSTADTLQEIQVQYCMGYCIPATERAMGCGNGSCLLTEVLAPLPSFALKRELDRACQRPTPRPSISVTGALISNPH